MGDPIDKLYERVRHDHAGAREALSERLYAKLFPPVWIALLLAYVVVTYHFKSVLLVRYGIGSSGLIFGSFLIVGVSNWITRLLARAIIGAANDRA